MAGVWANNGSIGSGLTTTAPSGTLGAEVIVKRPVQMLPRGVASAFADLEDCRLPILV